MSLKQILKKYIFIIIIFNFGCSSTLWENMGDSCVFTAKKPPLRRVVNYRDNDLCDRQLPARNAPFPRIRSNKEMD